MSKKSCTFALNEYFKSFRFLIDILDYEKFILL